MSPPHRLFPFLLLLALATFLTPARAYAPQFSEGARVEVDVNMNSDPASGRWMPAVIQQVDLVNRGYWVELDGQPGKDNWKIIPIRTNQWVRPGKPAAAAPAMQPAPPLPGIASQPKPTPTRGEASAAGGETHNEIKQHTGPHEPTVEHIKAMITADMTFKHKLEWDEVQITFTELTVGQPYIEKPKNNLERNSLAYARRLGVEVHPVKAKFSILVRSKAGTEHLYEYDRTALWYISNPRSECTLSKTGKPIDWVVLR